ncbi:MAG: low affinity iron permease family protein [Coriobacteriales bacterium]|nr:low affinity iron permease family protein [Coriobacteriales bacterium]
MNRLFTKFSEGAAFVTGSPFAFALAAAVIVGWALTGPMYRFSDTWQLIINTGTTIVTFLMVFVIQNAQDRDLRALQLKLDVLLEAMHQNKMIDVEELSDEELRKLQKSFRERLGEMGESG